jgi:hypothetical protein
MIQDLPQTITYSDEIIKIGIAPPPCQHLLQRKRVSIKEDPTSSYSRTTFNREGLLVVLPVLSGSGEGMIQCEECKYKTGYKCWFYGNMTLVQQSKKIVWGCEKYRSSWKMHTH